MSLPILSIARRRAFPPRTSRFTAPFWESLAGGALTTTACARCEKLTFPPKPICPHCWSSDVRWIELSAKGLLYAATVIHAAPAIFSDEAPIPVCVVDLAEGLRIATRLLVNPDAPLPALDTPVEIVVLAYEDGPLFAARPIPAA